MLLFHEDKIKRLLYRVVFCLFFCVLFFEANPFLVAAEDASFVE